MKIKLFLLASASLFMFSCSDEENSSLSLPEPVVPPIINTPKRVVLYYPSYARYTDNNTAESILSGANGDYAHDVFVPSFFIIGDGKTVIGAEPKAWGKNKLGFDDVYAWAGLSWNPDGTLGFSNSLNIGTGNIAAGLNKYQNTPWGIAIGGWPKDDDPKDPLRTGGFDRIGSNSLDLEEFVQDIANAEQINKVTRLATSIHIDYEFPETAAQGEYLLKITKAIYLKLGNKYKISVALGPNIEKHLNYLNFSELNKYVDYFEAMTYDFNGAWSNVTGHHTPIYSNPNIPQNPNLSLNFSLDAIVNYLTNKGIPANKIQVGVALYGRYWTNVDFPAIIDPSKPYFYRNGNQVAYPENDRAFIYDNTIKYNKLISTVTAGNGWEFYRDPISKAPFAIHRVNKTFITYDDVTSVKEKAAYVKQKGLGGVLVWDATGCTGTTILRELRDALK